MSPPPSVLLCVVHPSPEVRAEVAAAFPSCARTASAASAATLPGSSEEAAVVVLLDPALTRPADVLTRFDRRPHLVSISDLRVAPHEVGVDVVLPRRRLDERRVRRMLVLLELLPRLAGTAT